MAAPTSYPSYAYNSTQQSTVVVTTVAAFNALPLPGVWTTTPYPGVSGIPTDPGLTDTDIRLQQILIENRVQSQFLSYLYGTADDPVEIRAEVLANDSSLTS